MIDNFSLALTHGLMLIAAWRLLFRPDLDEEVSPRGPGSGPSAGAAGPGPSPGSGPADA